MTEQFRTLAMFKLCLSTCYVRARRFESKLGITRELWEQLGNKKRTTSLRHTCSGSALSEIELLTIQTTRLSHRQQFPLSLLITWTYICEQLQISLLCPFIFLLWQSDKYKTRQSLALDVQLPNILCRLFSHRPLDVQLIYPHLPIIKYK